MRTTLDVDEKLMETMLKMTGEKSKSKAVNKAMEDFIRRKSIDDLRAMAGKILIDDLQQEQKAADELRQELLDKLWRGEDGNR
jgi:Arc/MetJ family transcription regulator